MSEDEVEAFLRGAKKVQVATVNPDGSPHLATLFYVVRDGRIAFWTYGKSQKIRNIERDPRITCLVETGDTYDQLRGVELVGTATILTDAADVQAVGESVYERYTGPVNDQARAAVAAMGAKRAAVVIDVEQTVTWDHRKLGGTY